MFVFSNEYKRIELCYSFGSYTPTVHDGDSIYYPHLNDLSDYFIVDTENKTIFILDKSIIFSIFNNGNFTVYYGDSNVLTSLNTYGAINVFSPDHLCSGNGSSLYIHPLSYFGISSAPSDCDYSQYMPLSALPVGYSYVDGVFNAPNVSFSVSSSLNGDYGSFKDSLNVLCYPSIVINYIIQKSYFVAAGDGTLTIMYDLIDGVGNIHRAPHSFLTLVV
jgi:hypothetical protein